MSSTTPSTGHPKGLAVLFATEMWERFNYYGMRAILVLFLTKALLFDKAFASNLYGSYTGLVFLTPLLGGYIADRFWGNQRSIILGGLLMALGEFVLFFCASLYSTEKDMGINVGGAMGPIICGLVGDTGNPADFKWAFLAGGIAMLISVVVQFAFHRKYVLDPNNKVLGLTPANSPAAWTRPINIALFLTVVSAIMIAALYVDTNVVDYLAYVLVASPLLIGYIIFSDKSLSVIEKQRVAVIFSVSFFVVFFWSAFEQAGASLTFFAEEQTERDLGIFTVPASFFSSLNSIYVVLFAPLFAWLWLKMGKREPSSPTKMSIGLFLLSLGYLWIAIGVKDVEADTKVSIMWLLGMYALHTWGELCLSPIGLSLVNKLAPLKFASLLMAVWFLASAAASKLAGVLSALYPDGKTTQFMGYQMNNLYDFFILFVVMSGIAAALLLVLTKLLQKLMNS
jgi:POT family proton-dependent oligopeptide transporter